MKYIGLVALALPLLASAQVPAAAKERLFSAMEGTTYTKLSRTAKNGVLEGCGVEFGGVARDRSGSPFYRFSGSYNINAKPIGFLLKVGVFGIEAPFKPLPVKFAYVVVPDGGVAKSVQGKSDTPGFILSFGAASTQMFSTLDAIYATGKFRVGFNEGGGFDNFFDVDLSVRDTQMVDIEPVKQRSSETKLEFLACMSEMLKNIK